MGRWRGGAVCAVPAVVRLRVCWGVGFVLCRRGRTMAKRRSKGTSLRKLLTKASWRLGLVRRGGSDGRAVGDADGLACPVTLTLGSQCCVPTGAIELVLA